jgi:hypothetical protein
LVGSESGQKQSVKFLQYMVYNKGEPIITTARSVAIVYFYLISLDKKNYSSEEYKKNVGFEQNVKYIFSAQVFIGTV